MKLPIDLKPVLAKIERQDSLGKSTFFEVVYYDNDFAHGWKAYSGSDTFLDGETVIAWQYVEALEHMLVEG